MPDKQGSYHLETSTSLDLDALRLNPHVTRRGFMAVAAATAARHGWQLADSPYSQPQLKLRRPHWAQNWKELSISTTGNIGRSAAGFHLLIR